MNADTSAMVVGGRDAEDLLHVRYIRTFPSGAMTIHHPGGGSDDLDDALMLASWAFRPRATRKSRVRSIPRARPPWG